MRVVAGDARGRPIQAPPGTDTRPTADRVREAVFNALASLDAVVDSVVVDLFAGSGALGIEALSRGAAEVHFVDADRRAADTVVANLTTLGMTDRAEVHRSTVTGALRRPATLPDQVDLVLADPPYDFDAWDELLDALSSRVAPDGVVVVESGRPVAVPPGWEKLRERSYGGTVVVFARPPGPTGTAGPDPTGADA